MLTSDSKTRSDDRSQGQFLVGVRRAKREEGGERERRGKDDFVEYEFKDWKGRIAIKLELER